MKKILILGSGALKIGEAGEFDYSGSQAIKAYKEEGIKTVLINPNIATIQTSEHLADKVYFLPVTPEVVEKVIQKERPDAITISFGGQTALNCGIALYKKKVFEKYKILLVGSPIQSVILSEDRALFARHLKKIKEPIPVSKTITSVSEAEELGKQIGFPVMVRAGFTLGGQKSGVVYSREELKKKVTEALIFAPQVLIEKYLHHYKEVEYEIVRDRFDNCIAVCNMENFDPMGIHTGDSIVVAPSQTLNNSEYQTLRLAAIKIVRSLGIVGECNVQFGLNPKPKNGKIEYYVIELNARLSRSSALASKATGYPLAYVAAKLSLGKSLIEVRNQVTQITQSCFEPALDYIVVKVPRWDLEKFKGVSQKIGSSMKSVGEVMAIGRTFEEAIQKAVRMLDIGVEGVMNGINGDHATDPLESIKNPTPKRIFSITHALERGIDMKRIYQISGIDPWFLSRLQNIVLLYQELKRNRNLTKSKLRLLKEFGFSDKQIGRASQLSETDVRRKRKEFGIVPSVLQIDTLAGEVPAKTNYLYLTYHASVSDVKPIKKQGVIVLGSGPYRIGSSVEFDWTCVNTAIHLKKQGKKSIIVNCNPETVSTDYDMSDRLYFEELTFERIADIYDFENASGLIVSVGGQTPNTLSKKLDESNIPLLGTKADSIDWAEDRNKFSKLLDSLEIKQPRWVTCTSLDSALQFAREVGFPILVRPSYVLSGNAMSVCYSEKELKEIVVKTSDINKKHPVTLSQFIMDAKEIELDGVAQDGVIQVSALSEHIENAGVHSGDATIIFPVLRVYSHTEMQIRESAEKLVKALRITGPFNIQFLAKEGNVYIIEMNLRASRTIPFISKATRVNFAQSIVEALYKKSEKIEIRYPDFFLVKAPQFSFARLEGADPVLRVEMASTGEVACFGKDADSAYLTAIFSTGVSLTKKTALVTLGGDANKEKFLPYVWTLRNLGYRIYATPNTHAFLKKKKVTSTKVYKVYENKHPNVIDCIEQKKASLIFIVNERYDYDPKHFEQKLSDGFLIRRAAVDNNIPLFTDMHTSRFFVTALSKQYNKHIQINSWDEFTLPKRTVQ